MAQFIFLPSKVGECHFFGLASPVTTIQFTIRFYFKAHNKVEVANHPIAKKKKKKNGAGRDSPSPGGRMIGDKKMGGLCSTHPSTQAMKCNLFMLFTLMIPCNARETGERLSCGPVLIQSRFRTTSSIIVLGHSAGELSNHSRGHRFDLTSLSAFTQVNRTWNYGDT